MTKLKLKVVIFSKHTSGYCSYKGNLGKIAPNTLKQKFTETEPLKVLHTDVTQIRLRKDKWGYISAVLDQASGEILSYSISLSPNKLITNIRYSRKIEAKYSSLFKANPSL
nr:hypothetical protein [Limosilactobacillus reuteri]